MYLHHSNQQWQICSQLPFYRNMEGNADNAVFVIAINVSHFQLFPLHSLFLKTSLATKINLLCELEAEVWAK